MARKIEGILFWSILVLSFSGCLTSAPPPPKSWIVSASRSSNSELMIDRVSRLGSITVASPYDKPALTVKRKDGSVAFDAYNAFASSPSALLRAPLTAILEDDGRFGRVLSTVSTARANSTLEVVVTDLSLDCTVEGKRTAKVSISIAVIENREIKMFLDGSGSADAASGNYSESFSAALSQAVLDALKSMPEK